MMLVGFVARLPVARSRRDQTRVPVNDEEGRSWYPSFSGFKSSSFLSVGPRVRYFLYDSCLIAMLRFGFKFVGSSKKVRWRR